MQSEKTKTGPLVQQAINTHVCVVTKAKKKKSVMFWIWCIVFSWHYYSMPMINSFCCCVVNSSQVSFIFKATNDKSQCLGGFFIICAVHNTLCPWTRNSRKEKLPHRKKPFQLRNKPQEELHRRDPAKDVSWCGTKPTKTQIFRSQWENVDTCRLSYTCEDCGSRRTAEWHLSHTISSPLKTLLI